MLPIPYIVTYASVTILAVCFVILYVEFKLSSLRRQVLDFEEAILSYIDRGGNATGPTPSSPK